MSILWPIHLDTDFSTHKLSNEILIRDITDEDLTTFWGIKSRRLDAEGRVAGISYLQARPIENKKDHYYDFKKAECNKVVELERDDDLAKYFNIALKLRGLCYSGIFEGHGTDVWVYEPHALGWRNLPRAKLTLAETEGLMEDIKLAKERLELEKFKLILNRYQYALSCENIPLPNRFVDLVTILEMLFLPDETNELSFRMSLRIAKLLASDLKTTPTNLFDEMKSGKKGIYNLRSKIVHVGDASNLEAKDCIRLAEITRCAIYKFLKKPEDFSESNLKAVVF